MKFYIMIFLQLLPIGTLGNKLKNVHLEDYGSLEKVSIENTIHRALQDIDGKRLILPDIPIDCYEIKIASKSNFAIVGNLNAPITCKSFQIIDCSHFELAELFVKGTVNKFTTFNIVGDCSDFLIHKCLFDSERQTDGHNTFYGIHIMANTQSKNASYTNSPRKFRICDNVVRNTRYDGILAHAFCSDMVIERNEIESPECIGIEVEGRLGGAKNTTVHPCKNAIIRSNKMKNCGDWGILLMWVENAEVKNNVSLNGFGPFLSIGCKYLKVKNNLFEGSGKGFEISQEYYKVSNGINEHVVVSGNTIKGFPRAWDRGLLDIRHARGVVVKKNKFLSVDREQSCYISVSSSQNINISGNEFKPTTIPLKITVKINDVKDPETGGEVEDLNSRNIKLSKNIFVNIPYKLDTGTLDLKTRRIVIK